MSVPFGSLRTTGKPLAPISGLTPDPVFVETFLGLGAMTISIKSPFAATRRVTLD